MILVMIASVLVVIGVFLPWVSATVSGPMGTVSAGAKTGFELHQGMISVAVAIVSAILGIAAGRAIPRRAVAFLVLLAGIAVVVLAGNMMTEPLTQVVGPFTGHASLGPGVFASLVGGILLLFGGLSLFRSK